MKYYISSIALVITLLWVGPQHLSAQPANPNGELQQTSPEDIWAQTLVGSRFNEFWSYHFFLEDDLKVHVTFSAANFGSLKSPVTGVRVSIYGFDEHMYQVSREYDIDNLIQDTDKHIFKLREGTEVWFKGELPYDHQVRVKTYKDGVHYDMQFNLSDIEPGFKWGDGIYKVGNEPIGIFTHIPYARVDGYLKVNDAKREVNGTAYMDHTFQHQTTTKLMDSGYRFVSHTDRDNWDVFYFMLPSRTHEQMTIGHRVQNKDGEKDLHEVNSIYGQENSRAFGKRFAHSLDLMLIQPQGELRIVNLVRTKDDERFSLLSELSWIARRAARTFLGGEVLEFRGEAELNDIGDVTSKGYYNYFIVD